MSKSIHALMLLIVFALASIVPWADAQQKPSNVLIWCQNTNGTSSPCVAGNSLDYDTGGGTVNQGTVGIALPASGGPVAGGTSTNPIRVDPTGTTTQPVSGTVTANAGTNLNTSSLLTTTAHDAAFGTAGTADSQVRTIQGIASMTPVQVQSNSANLSTLAEQQTQTTALQLIDNLPLSQGSSTSGQSGVLVQGAVTTAAPTYTTGNSNPISLQTDGSQRVAVTNTPAVSQSGTWNIGTVTTLPALPANQSTNVAQINGVTPLMGNGASGTGAQRVTIANDSTGILAGVTTVSTVTNLSQLGGTAIAMNTGTRSAGTQRVTIATDDVVPASQSGTWTVQPGNTANTTPWLMSHIPATSGGTSVCYITSAASTNATNCKASAGQLYGFDLVNTTGTIYYLRLYNLSSAPTCSSATGFVRTIPIPASTTGAGIARSIPVGEAYGTGVGFCLTGGGSSTDNTNAATGVYVTLNYK